MMKVLTLLLFCLVAISDAHAASLAIKSEHSYAQEYKPLRLLLESVKDAESALAYKTAIEKEIQRLRQNQPSGAEYFNSLSNADKKLFIKRFQKNHFHCGEVTQVMEERRRILFDPKLSEILADTLNQILLTSSFN